MSFGGFSFGGGAAAGAGSSQPNQPTGGGLFGQSAQQPAGAQPAAPQPATGGGLFGSTAPKPEAGGGLFGQQSSAPTAPSGGLFGQPSQQPSSLFSNTQNTQNSAQPGQQQQQQSGGGLFGASGANSANNGNTGGGLFGSTQQQQQQPSSGGLFGGTQQQQQQPQAGGGGLFGSTQQQQPSGGGLFGQKPAAPSGGLGGLFGQSQPQQAGGGLFGQSQPPAQGSLFGQAQPQSSLFGQSQAQTQPQQPQQLQQSTLSQSVGRPPQSSNKDIAAVIEEIKNAWDPNHPSCAFQLYFYNLVPPEQVSQYGRPAIVKNDKSWARAVSENPDPTRLVPAPAFSLDDVQKRAIAQGKQATAHLVRLSELQEKLRKMLLNTSLDHSPRLQRAAVMHAQLSARILKIVKRLHLLLPNLRASGIKLEEEKLSTEYEHINNTIQKARIGGRVNESWALVGALKSRKEEGTASKSAGWQVVDDDGMMELSDILRNQQTGLSHLTNTLQKIETDLNVVRSGFGLESLTI
ncbi:hypothetical protein E3P96_03333 [Wallemia ichthyophaga]|nr:hypothetical protein E3P96_03333 [Wallemia ichthyophaga]